MGRLIDADKIIDSLGNSDMDFAIGAVIDEQPTVFDIDKVVEQLEEVEKIMTSPVTKDCFGEECRASDCTVCLINKAIEIVKGGGVE
jgi:hypothetical protein